MSEEYEVDYDLGGPPSKNSQKEEDQTTSHEGISTGFYLESKTCYLNPEGIWVPVEDKFAKRMVIRDWIIHFEEGLKVAKRLLEMNRE